MPRGTGAFEGQGRCCYPDPLVARAAASWVVTQANRTNAAIRWLWANAKSFARAIRYTAAVA